ncbi:hypothetical protein CANCADRAFT_30177 [Tortispora caseinolytica NRRL Y-17796]|uniref:Cyclin-like domain-containing protein n=1 Tax=Tortispora caseinolytica NRRL Y-17796 TaxID=767744 RepID=A0A1E4TJB8_9ASCO|nr:hypothetical protein CANCADRAFT_30177 [Tortispora caseinolytica NRRL Y-17796]
MSNIYIARPYLNDNQLKYIENELHTNISVMPMQFHQTSYGFMTQLAEKLKLPRRTIETSMKLYWRYYIFSTEPVNDQKNYQIVCACLFLASKTEDTVKRSKEIAELATDLLAKQKSLDQSADSFRKAMLQYESSLLQLNSFDFRVAHAGPLVVSLGKHLQLTKDICLNAYIISFEIIRSLVIVQHTPQTIALSALDISQRLMTPSLSDLKSFEPETLCTTSALLDDCRSKILNFYTDNVSNQDLQGLKSKDQVMQVGLSYSNKETWTSSSPSQRDQHPPPTKFPLLKCIAQEPPTNQQQQLRFALETQVTENYQ